MSDLFKASKRESAVDIVVNSVKKLLLERRLKPGDKLPSELEISEGLGVSRGSVREAMKILNALGLVSVRVGNGTFVNCSPDSKLLESFFFNFFVSNPNTKNLYELRHMFEIDVLELILKNYDSNENERKAIKENLNELTTLIENNGNRQQLHDNDMAFHRLMGKATCNPLVEQIYNFIMDFLSPSIASTHKHQRGEIIYKAHKAVMDIIEQRDTAQIVKVITDSVDTWSTLQNEDEDVD